MVLAQVGQGGECKVEYEEGEGAILQDEKEVLDSVLEIWKWMDVRGVDVEEPYHFYSILTSHLNLFLLQDV